MVNSFAFSYGDRKNFCASGPSIEEQRGRNNEVIPGGLTVARTNTVPQETLVLRVVDELLYYPNIHNNSYTTSYTNNWHHSV